MLVKPQTAEVRVFPCYDIWMGEDGITRLIYKPDQPFTLDDLKKQLVVIQQLNDGKKARVVGDFSRLKRLTADLQTRRYSTGTEAARVFCASAIVGTTGLSRVLTNLYLTMTMQTFPLRLFADEASAVAWLLSQSCE